MPVLGTGTFSGDAINAELEALTRRAFVPQLVTRIWSDYAGAFSNGGVGATRHWCKRSRLELEARMDRFVAWKRKQHRQRAMIHLYVAAGIFFGAPVVIFVATWLWRFALDAVIG